LVEDNPGDVRLTIEALRESRVIASVAVAKDGIEGLDMLRQRPPHEEEPRPDLILLDLNLPRMDGRELLEVIGKSPDLRNIPVVILTTSAAEQDIAQACKLRTSCYLTKPIDPEQFINVVQSIDDFWFTLTETAEQKEDTDD